VSSLYKMDTTEATSTTKWTKT